VADDVVSIGTVNLDAWALYRNSEIVLLARSPELAAVVEDRLFAQDIAHSRRAEPPAGGARVSARFAHALAYYL
jgi:phosphatidylserine/phosphatidylglycerophosphate/cardiolipin synthase-like enzyme